MSYKILTIVKGMRGKVKRVAIIQARMGSSRLRGKVMMELCDKTVLDHVIQRVAQCKHIDEVVIATTTKEEDDVIAEEAIKCKASVYRGSENNVLERYYFAAKESHAETVIRITSDCPLIDSNIVDDVIKFYEENNYELVSNAGDGEGQRTYPRGLDVEVFSMKALEKAYYNANIEYQLEHVTPYIYENTNQIYYYKQEQDYSNHRWTLDTKEDYELIKYIYNELYKGKQNFFLKEILELFKRKPEIYGINCEVKQKTY